MATMSHHLKSETPAWPVFAAVGAGLSVLLTAIGTFWDLSGNDPGGNDGLGDYLPVVGVIAVATAIAFAVATRFATPAVALVLSVLAVLAVGVAWSGLPMVLAAAGLSIAWPRRSETTAKASVALGVLAFVGAVAFAIWG